MMIIIIMIKPQPVWRIFANTVSRRQIMVADGTGSSSAPPGMNEVRAGRAGRHSAPTGREGAAMEPHSFLIK